MTPDELGGAGGAMDLEKKKGLSPWVIFGIVLLVIGVVFGVRRATKKPSETTYDFGPPATEKT